MLLWDGSLTVLLTVAYIACQPWRKVPAPAADGSTPARGTGGQVAERVPAGSAPR